MQLKLLSIETKASQSTVDVDWDAMNSQFDSNWRRFSFIRYPILLLLGIGSSGLPGCSGSVAPPVKTPPVETRSQTETQADASSTEATDESPADPRTEAGMQKVPVAEGAPAHAESSERTDSTSDEPDSSIAPLQTEDVVLTRKTVSTLREKSKRAADQKEVGNAFRLASEAWTFARSHPEDAELQQQADELAAELNRLGNQLNSRFQSQVSDPTVRLIEK
jgi:hypothetical protein